MRDGRNPRRAETERSHAAALLTTLANSDSLCRLLEAYVEGGQLLQESLKQRPTLYGFIPRT